MRVTIQIRTANAAFTDRGERERERLIMEAAERVCDGADKGVLLDYNGAQVGTFTVAGR